MGLDIGSKRTGISISDENGTIAFPYKHIIAFKKEDWLRQIRAIIEEKEVNALVIGIPLNQHGEAGDDAKGIREYIALLQERTALPLIELDERFTTVQAERILIDADMRREKRKNVIDQVAATILLQSYLDCKMSKPEPD